MAPQSRSILKEWVKLLLIPAISALVTAAFAVGSFKSDFRSLENRVDNNKIQAEQLFARNEKSLENAVTIRKAEVEARIVPVEAAYKNQSDVLRELIVLARENAKGNEQVLVRIAKIEGKLDAYGEKLTEHIREGK